MKKNLVYVLCVITFLTGCSSAYRTSQTPDDVYYSPSQRNNSGTDEYESYTSSSDDAYLRMKVQDHYRWSSIDDFDYWYDSRYYYNNYYSPWNSYYSSWNNWYSPYTSYGYNSWSSWNHPYCTVVYYKNPRAYYKLNSGYHLSAYNNHNYNTSNVPLQNGNRNIYTGTNANRNRSTMINQQNNSSRPVRLFNKNNNSNINNSNRISTNTNSGSRSGGFNSSGSSTHTRPPKGN